MPEKNELFVITKVKELTKYVFTVTEKSPKRFRYTMVSRLQNYCLDITENLFLANKLPLGEERLKKQEEASRLLSLIAYLSFLASECNCLIKHQFVTISKLQAEALLYLGKWIASDKKRANH